jgi:hypothetical protein
MLKIAASRDWDIINPGAFFGKQKKIKPAECNYKFLIPICKCKLFLLFFFLDKKEAKKSRTKDIHPPESIRDPAAMTIGCATVASAFIVCYCIKYFVVPNYYQKENILSD